MKTFASDLKTPEGPVALPDGSFIVVEGGRGCVTQISSDGQSKRTIAVTGEPNGLAVDSTGVIWVADIRPPALIRLSMDGKFERVLTACHGEDFLFPNDLCFGPDGALYLTDSGFQVDDFVFFFNDTATTEIYTLSLHDALPISLRPSRWQAAARQAAAARPSRQ